MKLQIRQANHGDLQFLFSLRNDPSVITASFSKSQVSDAEHAKWLENVLANPSLVLYVALFDGRLIGQIRFDLNDSKSCGEVSISILDSDRGKGLGKQLLHQGCRKIFSDFGIPVIVAHVLLENETSIKAFQAVGFKSCGTVSTKGQSCHKLILDLTS